MYFISIWFSLLSFITVFTWMCLLHFCLCVLIWILFLKQPFVPKENILMLQESSIDPLGATIVYAPLDLPAITSVVNGEDTLKIPILPSGFVISSDGRTNKGLGTSSGSSTNGSLLTVAFQILVCCSSLSKQLNMESVATVHSLISSTIQKIKVALDCSELDWRINNLMVLDHIISR